MPEGRNCRLCQVPHRYRRTGVGRWLWDENATNGGGSDGPRRDAHAGPGASPRRGSKRDLRVGVVATRRCTVHVGGCVVTIGARVGTHRWRIVTTRRGVVAIGRGDVTIVAGVVTTPAPEVTTQTPNVLTPAPPFDSASAIGRSPDATVATTPATLRTGARLVRRARCSGASRRGFAWRWRAACTARTAGAGRGPRGWACRAAWPPAAQSRQA